MELTTAVVGANFVSAMATLGIVYLTWRQARIANRTLGVLEAQEARRSRLASLSLDEYFLQRRDGAARMLAVRITVVNSSDVSWAAVRTKLSLSYSRVRSPKLELLIEPSACDVALEPRLTFPLSLPARGAASGWLCFDRPLDLLKEAQINGYKLIVETSDGQSIAETLGLVGERPSAA